MTGQDRKRALMPSTVTDSLIFPDMSGEPGIVEPLGGADAIRHHCDPVNYLGLAPQMVVYMLSQLPAAVIKPGAR